MTQDTQSTSLADELAEKVWQALARHGTLLDDIERRSVVEALRTRPTEARTGGDALRERDAMFLRGHAAGLREAEWDEEDGDAAKCEAIADKISALSHPTPADDAGKGGDFYAERVKYEERILAVEMENERLKRSLACYGTYHPGDDA